MTDEEQKRFVEETKQIYQRWPWKQVITTVVAAFIIGSASWGLGVIGKLESTVNAAEKVPKHKKKISTNAQDIDEIRSELESLEEGQTQILDRLSELRQDLRNTE